MADHDTHDHTGIPGVGASGAVTSSGLTMATARLLGRTTASTGAIEEITVGSGLSLSAGSLTASGGASITAGTTFLTSNVSQVTAGTWYSGPNTGSLAAGDYLLSGQLYVDCSSLGGVNEESVRIFDGSAAVATAAAIFQNATNQRLSIVISQVKVTIGGATTFTIQATNTSNGGTIKDTLDNGGTADKASWISYVKIA